MRAKMIAWWHSLPGPVKTGIVIFGGAATGVIRHVLQNPDACMTASCWKGYLVAAGHAGGLALIAWLVPSPLDTPKNIDAPAA